MTVPLRIVYWLCTAVCLWGIFGGFTQAQNLRPDNAIGVALDQNLSPTQENLAKRIGSRLRCPVCQGVPISESPADLARQMMLEVRKQVKVGQNESQINTFFASRYGSCRVSCKNHFVYKNKGAFQEGIFFQDEVSYVLFGKRYVL